MLTHDREPEQQYSFFPYAAYGIHAKHLVFLSLEVIIPVNRENKHYERHAWVPEKIFLYLMGDVLIGRETRENFVGFVCAYVIFVVRWFDSSDNGGVGMLIMTNIQLVEYTYNSCVHLYTPLFICNSFYRRECKRL